MLEFGNHDPARQDTPGILGFGIIFGNLKHLEAAYTSYIWPGLSKSHS